MFDVAFGESGHEDLLDIGGEELAVDRPVDDPGCIDPVAAQGSDEGQGFPVMGWTPPDGIDVPKWSR